MGETDPIFCNDFYMFSFMKFNTKSLPLWKIKHNRQHWFSSPKMEVNFRLVIVGVSELLSLIIEHWNGPHISSSQEKW